MRTSWGGPEEGHGLESVECRVANFLETWDRTVLEKHRAQRRLGGTGRREKQRAQRWAQGAEKAEGAETAREHRAQRR